MSDMEHWPAGSLQGSAEWFKERAGKVTASRFKDAMDKLKKGGYGSKREGYKWELVTERITGFAVDHYASTAMQWGTDQEPVSRMAYEARTGLMVEEAGFILHPDIPTVGGSPDGLIGDDGGVEYKNPFNSAVHLACFIDGMPDEHRPQIQGLLWITGRKWWDFVSHDSRMPEPYTLYIQRILPDPEFIAEMETHVRAMLADVDATLAQVIQGAAK